MALYDTVANIVSETAVQCGLGAVSDVFASTDANVVQMRGLLSSVGRRLVLRYPWLQCVKEHTFTTTSATSYSLPADFQSMVDQTGWNRTSDHQLYPASRQEWQYIKAVDTAATLATIFKPKDLTIEIHQPTSGETIAFEYRSRYWVALTGSTTPTLDAPAANTNVICLDVELVKAALKYQFLKDKGFDSSAALEDFRQVLSDVQGANVNAASMLSLNGSDYGDRLIDSSNAPETGYGFDGWGGLH